MRSPVIHGAVLMMVVLAAHESTAQTLDIRFAPTCRNCVVELTQVFTLGGARYVDQIGERGLLRRDSRGNLYALGPLRTSISVFDSVGRFIQNFGRAGSGPGEFARSISDFFIGAGDTLYVLDSGNRLSVFSPSHKYVRVVQIPRAPQGLGLSSSGRVIFGGLVRQSAQIGFPLHILDWDAKIIKSFGSEISVTPNQRDFDQPVSFYMGSGRTSLWKWIGSEYRIEEWSEQGSKLRELRVVGAPGMATVPARGGRANLTPEQLLALMRDTSARGRAALSQINAGRPPQVAFLKVDSQNRLWALSAAPQLSLHVVDLQKRELLVAQPVAVNPTFLSNDLAYSFRPDSSGLIVFTIWRVKLAGAGS